MMMRRRRRNYGVVAKWRGKSSRIAVGGRGGGRSPAEMAAVRRQVAAPRRAGVVVADRQPTVLYVAPATGHAAHPARAVHRRTLVEVHPE